MLVSSNGLATVGVIGGVGPDTTAEFYSALVGRCRELYDVSYPHIIVDSIPVPFAVEEELVVHGRGIEAYLPLLIASLATLERAGAAIIAMPCNTLHALYAEMETAASVPLLNILDETARQCRAAGARSVAVFGTPHTVHTRLYDPSLLAHGIETVDLRQPEVEQLARTIFALIEGRREPEYRAAILALIERVARRGADAVVLGCTDLQLAVRPGDADLPIPVIDSVAALVEGTAKALAAQ